MRYLIGLLLLVCSLSVSAQIAVIVHPDNQQNIDIADIKRLYTLRQFSYQNGSIAFLFMLPYSIPEREQFDQIVSGLSSNQLMTYWSKIVFAGKGTPPRSVRGIDEMLRVISVTPNSMGYVPEWALSDEWRERVLVVRILP